MINSFDVTKKLIAVVLIFTLLTTCCAINLVRVRDEIDLVQTQYERAEELIDIYEKDMEECHKLLHEYRNQLEEYRNLLDTETDKNAQLSNTINELEDKLTKLKGELVDLENDFLTHENQTKNCKKPITYSSDDVLTPSNVTAEELSSGLYYKLRGYAKYFVAAEKKYGVNAIFLASIAALESGWGRSTLAENKNNLFGYKNSNAKGYREFSSIGECIDTVARNLKSSYLTVGGKYYNGTSVADVNVKYCTSKGWASKVNNIANGIVDRIQED